QHFLPETVPCRSSLRGGPDASWLAARRSPRGAGAPGRPARRAGAARGWRGLAATGLRGCRARRGLRGPAAQAGRLQLRGASGGAGRRGGAGGTAGAAHARGGGRGLRRRAGPVRLLGLAAARARGAEADLYELHFLEVSPFVSRIVAVDPKMTQQGHQRNVSLNMSSPRFRRFGDQLRRVELESPTGGKTLSQLSVAERSSLLRSGREPLNSAFVLEQWTRAQMEQGFKDSHGNWEMEEGDIVIVADSDEIPLRHFLAALQYCEVPSFKMVNLMLDQGMEHTLACRGAVVPLRSQVYEYFMDCPTKQPIWMRPNVALARCLMNGEMDFEDVRTSSRHRTSPPRKVAARHLHNVGMSLQDIVFKYGHYVEPRTEFLDSGLDVETNQEMMWRGCDPRAPELGPGSWYMSLRPSNDFIDPRNARGYCVEYEGLRRGLDLPFALLEERPELAGGLLWRGHAELRNPFAGRKGGTNYFHD
ncbi:unnamed protein product, partial [Prorocentrum cordatum]